MNFIRTVDDVVDALGGDKKVAEWANLTQPAIANWKSRGEIPGGWHLRIYARLIADGYTCDLKVFGLTPSEAEAIQKAQHQREVCAPRPKRPRSAAQHV